MLCYIFPYDYTVNTRAMVERIFGCGNLWKADGFWDCRSHILQWWSVASLQYIKRSYIFQLQSVTWFYNICRVYLIKYQGFLNEIRPWKYAHISRVLLSGLCSGYIDNSLLIDVIYSAIFIRAGSLVVGQSPYCSSVCEVNLKHKPTSLISCYQT